MEIKQITKRDGRKTPFSIDKIAKAIYKAAQSVNGCDYGMAETLAEKVESRILSSIIGRDPSVEEIQDIVEETLIDEGHARTAKAYILYRAERTRVREANTALMKTYEDLTFSSAIESDTKRENANINGDTAMGVMLKYGSEGAKKFNLLNVLDPRHAKAHSEGDIHIHDLDFYTQTTTCCQIDLKKLFAKGFSTGHGNLRTPNGIQSYAALACIAIQSNQNDQHGGQSVPAFDYDMAEGVAKTFRTNYASNLSKSLMRASGLRPDSYRGVLECVKGAMKLAREKYDGPNLSRDNDAYFQIERENIMKSMYSRFYGSKGYDHDNLMNVHLCQKDAAALSEIETDRATYQAMEALIHNLNTMNSRAGAQVPFSSINYGTDTSPEGHMVVKNLLLATQAGLGGGETPIFPVQIFKVKSGVNYNPGDPNYDLFKLAMETSAKRMFPNFSFIDAPFNLKYYKPGDYRTEVGYMGCVIGTETVKLRIDDEPRDVTIGGMWDELAKTHKILGNGGDSKYIDISNNDIKVWDSWSGRYVKVFKWIYNPPHLNKWLKITLEDGKTLTATDNHPLPVVGKGRTHVIFLNENHDMLYEAVAPNPNWSMKNEDLRKPVKISKIEHLDLNEPSFDVETESDRFDVSGILSHNCRTRVMGNVYDPDREITPGRGNLSFTTINLPRLAIESHGSLSVFYEKLDKMMDLVSDQLMHRYKIIAQKTPRNFPFLMGQGVWIDSDELDIDEPLENILKHGTLSIGFIGLAETLVALTGKHHGESPEARETGLGIISHMRDYCNGKSKLMKMNFTLLATPAEGLSGRFVNIDKKRYGVIPGVTDQEFYTNSFHVPVYYDIPAFKKLEIEGPYHELTNAGHISYIELDGDPSKNIEAFEQVIRCMHDNNIGYGAINHPIDRDPICGFNGIIDDECPCCHRRETIEITERIARPKF